MINVALLSRWHVHADDYAKEAEENRNINIHTVWDEDPVRGRAWADELSVAFEPDLDKVLNHPEIDAVIVTTPTVDHAYIIQKAAVAKKHIFTEKVLALTVKECEEIYEAVENNDVHLMVSLPRLTESVYLSVAKIVQKQWLGEITNIRCRFTHDGALESKKHPTGWLPDRFYNPYEAAGGALLDLGAHPIYLVNRILGQPQSLYAVLKETQNRGLDDNAVVIANYKNNAIGVIETGFVSYGQLFQLEVYGSQGTLLFRNNEFEILSDDETKIKIRDELRKAKTLTSPLSQWVRQIIETIQPSITKMDALNLTLFNQMAQASVEKNREIKVNEIF